MKKSWPRCWPLGNRNSRVDAPFYPTVTPETLIPQLPVGLFVKDSFSVYIACNDRFASMLRAKPEGIVGQDDLQLFSPQTARAQRDEDRSVLESGRHRVSVAEFPERGSGRWVRLVKSPYRNEKGAIVGVLGYVEEVAAPAGVDAEEARRRDLQAKTRAIETSITATAMASADGTVTYANRAFLRLWGETDETRVIGRNVLSFWANAEEAAAVIEAMERDDLWRGEMTARRSDGTEFTALLSAGVTRSSGGEVQDMTATFVDITDRKRAEESLRESERRFEQSARQSRTVVWEVDPSGLFTFLSGATEEVLGYRPEELVGRLHYYELHPPEGREAFTNETLAVLDRREQFRDFENLIVAKDGRRVWVVTNGAPLFDRDGTLIGYRGSDTDITDRKRTRNALARSEALLRESQRIARVGTVEVDHVHGQQTWSEETFRLLELDGEAAVPSFSGILARIHPEDRNRVTKSLRTCAEEGGECDFRFRLLFPQGRVKHVRALGTTEQDAEGDLMRSVGILQDVTNMTHLREELLVRTQAMDTSVTPMAIADADGRVTYANTAFLRLWREPDEGAIIGRDATSFFAHPKQAAGIIERMPIEGSWTGEIDVRRSDGSTFTVLATASVVKDDKGEVRNLMATYLDVTERNQANALVRRHAAKFDALLNSALDGYWLADADGRILEVNEHASEMSDYSRDELLTMSVYDLDGNEDRQTLEEHISRVKATGYDRFRTSLSTKTGAPVDIELSATLWRSDGVDHLFAFFRDITSERKLAEAQNASAVAERANQAKSEFLSSMSHEL
ncbi:MAG: PAS domain S-box protein, partial [Spirochaetota bacterium]